MMRNPELYYYYYYYYSHEEDPSYYYIVKLRNHLYLNIDYNVSIMSHIHQVPFS